MRTMTGQAVLASAKHLTVETDAPSLPLLVSRIAAARALHRTASDSQWCTTADRRGLTLATPSPGLVTAPPSNRRLPVVGATLYSSTAVVLLAAHGGAGVSCLLRAGLETAGAVDARRAWPPAGPVLLVARTSVGGLESARDAVRQHASGTAGMDVNLLGLVLIADAPGRLPARAAALADLVCGAFDRLWVLPWLEQWRLASSTEPLPGHPEVSRLRKDLRALTSARTSQQGEHR
jgi:hypothetical protein